MTQLDFSGWEYFPLRAQTRQAGIPQPVVRPNDASRFDHCLDKACKAFCRSVRHMLKENPSDSVWSLILDANDAQRLAFRFFLTHL
jgi:hypothetical protein